MRILFVQNVNNIFEPKNGGEQRSHLLLKACLKLADVDVVTFGQDSVKDSLGANIIYSKFVPSNSFDYRSKKGKLKRLLLSNFPSYITRVDAYKEHIIDKIISERPKYDCIVVRYAMYAVNCGLMKYAERLIVDADDDASQQILIECPQPKTIFDKLFVKLYSSNVKRAMPLFHKKVKSVMYSNVNMVTSKHVTYLPNVPFYDINEMLPKSAMVSGRLLFVGELTYKPNIEAVNLFIDRVLPILKQSCQEISFHVVGKCDDSNKSLWSKSDGVKVCSFVDDIVKEYAEANVVVLPIKTSAGTCIKFLEAAQMGRPIVSSYSCYCPYSRYFQSGKNCLVADDLIDFAHDVVSVIRDESLFDSLSVSANKVYNLNYSKSAFYSIVTSVIVE